MQKNTKAITAHLITIGNEILIGQIVDSNSAYIATELNNIGIDVVEISSISDNEEHILETLARAEKTSDIVLMTGGLGPTKDDITKKTLCKYFNDTLVMNEDALGHIHRIFGEINREVNDLNKAQALMPSKSELLENEFGTAPGIWTQSNQKIYISLPGVPFEMKNLMQKQVLPKLIKQFDRPYILHKTILVVGIPESILAQQIEAWEDALPDFINLAYLPAGGRIRLRLTAKGVDKKILEDSISLELDKLDAIIGKNIQGYDGESLEKILADKLITKKLTIATAESCTGGYLSAQLTSIEGSSAYYVGGMVTYATRIKEDFLNISQNIIEKHTVVSEEVALIMAQNIKQKFKTDIGIATTGVAGPDENQDGVAAGTIIIAISSPFGDEVKRYTLPKTDREQFVKYTATALFQKLIDILKGGLNK